MSMMNGGRYEKEATEMMLATAADGIVLIVINGVKGQGFEVEVQYRPDFVEANGGLRETEKKMATVIRFVADQMAAGIQNQ